MLVAVVLPAGIMLVFYGLVTTVASAARQRSGYRSIPPSTAEKVVLYLGSSSALVLVTALTTYLLVSGQGSVRFFALLAIPVAVTAAAPLVLMNSSWRGLSEGVATLVMGALVILAGFSVGMFLVPSGLLMATAAGLQRRAALVRGT